MSAGDKVPIDSLNHPTDERDPRVTRTNEQIQRLQDRFNESGWLNPIIYTADDLLIVDGNTRVRALEDLDEHSHLRILGEYKGYVFALPEGELNIDPEEASAELNIFRENLSEPDRAKFLSYLIQSRIIEGDSRVAGDATCSSLLSNLENDRRDDRTYEWENEHEQESKAKLEEFLTALDFETPERARNILSSYNNAPEQIRELWILDELYSGHVTELRKIHDMLDEGSSLTDSQTAQSDDFQELIKHSKKEFEQDDEYYRRADLRNIADELENAQKDDPEDDDDVPADSIEEEELEEFKHEVSDEVHKKVEKVSEYTGEDEDDVFEELLKSEKDGEDFEEKLNNKVKNIDRLNREYQQRIEDRRKAVEEYDFSGSDFAEGDTEHLAPPVETENLGVFYHDVQQMGDEVSDGELDLIFTSPPYFTQSDSIVERWWPEGVELTDENITEENVDLAYQNYLDEMTEILSILHSKLKKGRYMILNVSDIQAYGTKKVYDVPSDLSYIIRNELNPQYETDSRFQYDATITWDKGKDQTNDRATTFFGSGRPLTYHPNWRCERLLVFRKGSTETPDDEFNLETQDFRRFSDDLWQISNTTIESDHSEGFATELAMKIIQLYSYPGDTVADPFGGYGITPFAVKTLNEQKYASNTNWKGLAWENFSSESTGDMDFRERTSQLLTGNLSLFRDEYFTA